MTSARIQIAPRGHSWHDDTLQADTNGLLVRSPVARHVAAKEVTTKEEAHGKIAVAAKACARVQGDWVAADKALGGSVSMNGWGVYSDRFALRTKLELARNHINDALNALDVIDWPTNAEYDLL